MPAITSPPPQPPEKGDGFTQYFSIRHGYALNCKHGRLIIACKNEVCDKIIHLAKRTFQQNCIQCKPLIHQGHRRSNNVVRHGRREKYSRGYVLIRGIWERQTDAIIKIRFGDPNCDSYKKEPMGSLIDQWEKGRKDKHGKHCHEQQENFSMFVLSIYGMLGK